MTAATGAGERWAGVEADVLALPQSQRGGHGPTPLQILRQLRREASHEHYLKFLFDPREVHGLGEQLLSALLLLAGLPELAHDPRLARASVHQQVRGATSRPDLIITGSAATIVVELKIDAREGLRQTSRQGDDFADLPDPVFVYLTPTGRPPGDPRFRPVALRDLAGHLARMLAQPHRGPDAPGVRHAHDYLNDLEATVGIAADDDDDARFWVTHSTALLAAQDAARRLLKQLPVYCLPVLGALAAELGGDLTVETVDYTAIGDSGSYPETAVIVSRPRWRDGGTPALGFGLGIRRESERHPGPDPDDRRLAPFHGVYCTHPAVREAIGRRFVSKGWGLCWGWWEYLPLTAQPDGVGFLDHNTAGLAALVRDAWHERVAAVDALWAAHRAP